MYWRFARGLREFLRRPISVAEAQAIVCRRLAQREDSFLNMVERGVYEHPSSPYRLLLRQAGCELGDLRDLVHTRGLEGALRSLHDAGVYVTFEEFKGHAPIVRGGQVIEAGASAFDNPHLGRYYEVESGGTTGAGTRTALDLDQLAATAVNTILAYDAHGVLRVPTVMWYGILPASAGLASVLHSARIGATPEKWLSPITADDLRPSVKNRLATGFVVAAGRLAGARLPWPELGSLDGVAVARWAHARVRAHGACLIRTSVSLALRVANAARAEGLDLTGATFLGGAEPPTPAKVRGITASGARYVPNYFITEAGAVGMGCAQPVDGSDVHFYRDSLALIQCPRHVPGTALTVDAFSFTSLLPSASKLLLNVEMDDYGVVEERACGCPLERHGLTQHLREIRSFRKLTGEGMTLVGTEMVHILEDVLPARFGGSPLDYQLVEEEDPDGFTRLSLLVSPRVRIDDEQQVIDTVLEALGRGSVAADLARALWAKARTLRVVRAEPIWTARGKLMPLHLGQRDRRDR
jgi:hypothetical protein